jgi:hypothetical protein
MIRLNCLGLPLELIVGYTVECSSNDSATFQFKVINNKPKELIDFYIKDQGYIMRDNPSLIPALILDSTERYTLIEKYADNPVEIAEAKRLLADKFTGKTNARIIL